MQPSENVTPREEGFSLTGHPDPFTAGDSVLDRARSVSQRIVDRVRELTQDTQRAELDDATDEHTPLPG